MNKYTTGYFGCHQPQHTPEHELPKQAYLLTGLLAYSLMSLLAYMLSYLSAYIGDHKSLLTAH